jgi:hypothetical protein
MSVDSARRRAEAAVDGAGERNEQAGTWTRPREAVLWMLRGRTARTATPVALVVGAVLSAVNQGPVIISGRIEWSTWLRVAVNFLVPFLVASAGYLSARRRPDIRRRDGVHEGPRH